MEAETKSGIGSIAGSVIPRRSPIMGREPPLAGGLNNNGQQNSSSLSNGGEINLKNCIISPHLVDQTTAVNPAQISHHQTAPSASSIANVEKSVPARFASTELINRRVTINHVLDENRRSRVESQILCALPPPSDLFLRKSSSSMIDKPTDEGGICNSSAISATLGSRMPRNNVTTVSPASSSTSELSKIGVLEPIKLPIGSRTPSVVADTSLPQFSQRSSVSRFQNAVASTSLPVFSRQLPLFSLTNNSTMPLVSPQYRFVTPAWNLPSYYGSLNLSHSADTQRVNEMLPPRLGPCVPFRIGEGEDLIEALDPLSASSRSGRNSKSLAFVSSISRAEQMEILYSDAPFADHARCDRMVAKCGGDISTALKELKTEYLVETLIASNREKAVQALSSRAWDLNAAAELLLSSS